MSQAQKEIQEYMSLLNFMDDLPNISEARAQFVQDMLGKKFCEKHISFYVLIAQGEKVPDFSTLPVIEGTKVVK